ncbi:MAG TPA: hypothetical protein VGV63_00825, partial [Acidimicrobiales bacterium]|nr:hypothetical protein [Acidimicrobiales bacterium]
WQQADEAPAIATAVGGNARLPHERCARYHSDSLAYGREVNSCGQPLGTAGYGALHTARWFGLPG